MPKEESLAVPFEELVRDRFIIGTPEECRNELERYHQVLGMNNFLLRLQWPGMPQKQVLSQIELLGQHVLPALKKASS
jgi:alkanesulfonate monooxygenase SsuD/methylene tetrahydromethanopterin reductase-like flavin-dependent oxidoreductase (luciferase family)